MNECNCGTTVLPRFYNNRLAMRDRVTRCPVAEQQRGIPVPFVTILYAPSVPNISLSFCLSHTSLPIISAAPLNFPLSILFPIWFTRFYPKGIECGSTLRFHAKRAYLVTSYTT